MMKTGEVASRLGIHPNTVRVWADECAEFLSKPATAAKRKFSDHDGRVLATVAKLRSEGLNYEQIRGALRDGRLVDILPPLPTPEEQAARQSIALVAMPEYQRVLDQIVTLRNELDLARQERDRAISTWQTDTTALNARITELEREIGQLQGALGEHNLVLRVVVVAAMGILVLAVVFMVVIASRGG
jgi:DNA-binding transcriptional MerR regulator